MNIQNPTETQTKDDIPLYKKKFGCGKIFLFLLLILVLYVVGNIIYGNFVKGQYQYTHSGQQIFSFKYSKKYHVKFSNYTTSTEVNNIPKGTQADDITVSRKCSIFELNFDCAYDITLRYTIYWKDSDSPQGQNLWTTDTNCRYEQLAGKQLCYLGNTRETSYIFGENYKIDILQSQAANKQTDINNILSSLVFK